jgi:hypothetical protein
MAYYIFLKSLRSLEEFRKNPHVKIPPKSPSTNFQSLGKFKNPIFIWKRIFFFAFGPIGSAASRPARPLSPASHWPFPFPPAGRARVLGPSRPARHWRIGQNTPPLHVCAARRRRLLPLSPPSGPHLSVPSPTSRRPTPATPPLLSATRRHPASTSRCRVKELTPRHDSPS